MVIPDSITDHITTIKNEDVSYRSTSYYSNINDIKSGNTIIVPTLSIFDKYRHFLEPIIYTEVLTEDQFMRYQFKPKTVSYDLYNTTELWAPILSINNCKSILDFNLHEIRVYDKDRLMQLLNEIMIIEGLL